MAEFLKEGALNAALEEIFSGATSELIVISPFIKLHNRFKDILKSKRDNAKLKITIVFGKNSKDKTRSINKDDFLFLSEFPNVEIRYEDRLHAKFYSNYDVSILSSMNLYDYSQNNNIEFGILTRATNILSETIQGNSIDRDAYSYFVKQVIPNSELLYQNIPEYETGLLGLSKKYIGIETKVDKLSSEFGTKRKASKAEAIGSTPKFSGKLVSATSLGKSKGFSYKQVVDCMEKKGLLNNGQITGLGTQYGLQMESKKDKKGDISSWVVYPEAITVLLE